MVLKKNREESKARKRKWKEEKLIKALEKEKSKKVEEQKTKQRKVEEEVQQKTSGRQYTVSIALPGTILDNAQTPELRTYLAGQIARAAVVFNVDEIIIFDETGSTRSTTEGEFQGVGKKGNSSIQMARVLQYLECPQYLRKSFFPQHKDLQYAGLLNPLASPHHVTAEEESAFREGVVLEKPTKPGKGSFVHVGFRKEIQIDKKLQPGVRVTVRMKNHSEGKKIQGKVVSPSTPRLEAGLYWGYTIRLAKSLAAVFTECPHKDGYDVTIGTSERGQPIDDYQASPFKHMLVVFGGLNGLEASLDADQDLHVDDPSLLFDVYLNTCPDQGSKTIRTEEAILITMATLRPKIQAAAQRRTNHLP